MSYSSNQMFKIFNRSLLVGLAILSFIFTACVGELSQQGSLSKSIVIAATEDQYTEQVNAGLDYFRQQAQVQLPLVETLVSALESGDLNAAKQAYVNARPPYEEIEVYAGSFEQEDSDIDARPYAFEEGAQSSDFRGFHRIERLIYGDGDTANSVPYAKGLVESVQSLINKLNDPSNFNAKMNFEGMITLATEVPAKKISSEEETWSDQSLLIFKHNWIGIYSQYEPYANVLKQKNPEIAAQVEQAYQACMKTVEPYFTSGEAAAKPYSSVGMDKRAKIVDASYQFRDALIQAQQALGLV